MNQRKATIRPDVLEGMETSEIIDHILQHVVKSNEELQEEKSEMRKKSTDLKIFVLKKEEFEIGSIETTLEKLATEESTHKNTVEFINNHGFSESMLNPNASLLEIRTPSYERTDKATFISSGDYVRVLSVERRQWTKKTIERVIDYLPSLSRLYLTANDISSIVTGLNEITKTDVSGFTSKYNSYRDDRRISIQFHGGGTDDIEHVEKEFDAKPTRVEFKQKNSPTDAVTGAVTRNARINIPGIRAGSEELGAETVNSVASKFEEIDKKHFDVPNAPAARMTDSGMVIEGFTTLNLYESDTNQREVITDGGESESGGGQSNHADVEKAFVEALTEDIFESKRRYDFTEWREHEEYLLLDKERNEMFQVGISDRDLIVNARPGTTSVTLKDFCRVILEDFKTTYDISSRTVDFSTT